MLCHLKVSIAFSSTIIYRMSEIYSDKIKTPIYTPTGDKPQIDELVDDKKVRGLNERIRSSNIPSDIQVFLRKAATRHYVYDYRKIAEYYAHAPKEVQELFEASHLVIIDFDKAIEEGYVQMNKRLMSVRSKQTNYDKEIHGKQKLRSTDIDARATE